MEKVLRVKSQISGAVRNPTAVKMKEDLPHGRLRLQAREKPSQFVSAVSIMCMFVVCACAISIGSKQQSSHRLATLLSQDDAFSNGRHLAEDFDTLDFDSEAVDDDTSRSETCKKYLYNFLNGTTDGNDECQAFKEAFEAADCEDDSHINAWTDYHEKNKEDPMIDDFFKNWEVRDNNVARHSNS